MKFARAFAPGPPKYQTNLPMVLPSPERPPTIAARPLLLLTEHSVYLITKWHNTEIEKGSNPSREDGEPKTFPMETRSPKGLWSRVCASTLKLALIKDCLGQLDLADI
jgi:hypothetical protein